MSIRKGNLLAIPDYQSLMLPLLNLLRNGDELHINDYTSLLADQFQLTDEERREMLPSGNQETFKNRAGWARTYLAKAALLEKVSRGTVKISPLGREILARNPERIDRNFLMQFESFRKFQQKSVATGNGISNVDVASSSDQSPVVVVESDDPVSRLEAAYDELRNSLAEELLDTIKSSSPQFFEAMVVDLLVAMGYGGSRRDAGQAVGRSGDDGIDGIIKEDRLGLDVVYIQAKRWENPVTRPMVQGFTGSLEGNRARKGVFITTSRFTADAKEYVNRIEKRIVLIDGEQLASHMIDFGIGVTEISTLRIQRMDQDYFDA